MSLGKKDIVNNISTKAFLSRLESKLLLEHFLILIKTKSVSHNIKLSKFGTFFYKSTPERIGRNPKTKINYSILPSKKLSFNPSNKVKKVLN